MPVFCKNVISSRTGIFFLNVRRILFRETAAGMLILAAVFTAHEIPRKRNLLTRISIRDSCATGGMNMSLLQVTDLSFSYEENYDPVFQNVSFRVDTDWRTGVVGRNGKGKTTFLKLLMGRWNTAGLSLPMPALIISRIPSQKGSWIP